MRYLLPLLVLSVETGVLGTPLHDPSLELPQPPHARNIQNERAILDTVSSCGNSFNLFTTASPSASARPIPTDFDYLSFCSAWNQPTTTATSFSYAATTITVTASTSTVTAVTTSTTTRPGSGTAAVTCPIPAPSMICGQGGWGYATNNIYSGSGIDAIACHELCLANSACQSFQVEIDGSTTAPTCNLYKVDPSGNNTIVSTAAPFAFFARGCPDHLPAACGSGTQPSSSPSITRAPPTTTSTPVVIVPPPSAANVAFVERAADDIPLPWFLQPFGPVTMSEICSCIYTRPIPATTVVAVVPTGTSVYKTIPGRVVTAVVTTVITVSGGQSQITSIA